MHPADSVVQILSDAAQRREHPEVVGAYRQLAGLIEAHLIGDAFFEVTPPDALSETQWALIRHGLRGMGEGSAFQSIQRAATQLRTSMKTFVGEPLPEGETPEVTDEYVDDGLPAGQPEPLEDELPVEDEMPVEDELTIEDEEDTPTTIIEPVEVGIYVEGVQEDEDDAPEGVIDWISYEDQPEDEDDRTWDDDMPIVMVEEELEPQDIVDEAYADEPESAIVRSEAVLSAQTAETSSEPPREDAQPDSFKQEYHRRAAIVRPAPRGFTFSRGPQVINHIDTVRDNATVNMIGFQSNRTIAMDDVITATASTVDSSNTIINRGNSSIEYDVFLSYSRRNARYMRRIREHLNFEGFTVWTDENLTPGTPDWQMAIETAILKSMCLVTLMSPDAHVSHWVKVEIKYAQDHGVLVVPVLIHGDERTSTPMPLSLTQHIDMRKEVYRTGINELLRTLRRLRSESSS